MRALDAIGHALAVAGSMTWQITWSLILGFTLSAVVQAVIRRQTIVRLLGDDRPKTLARATGLGAASSSCSYAAVALARSLFRKGAHFTAAMAFEIECKRRYDGEPRERDGKGEAQQRKDRGHRMSGRTTGCDSHDGPRG